MRSLKADDADRVLESKKPRSRKKPSTERTMPRRNRRRRMAWAGGLMAVLLVGATGVYGYSDNWHGKTAKAIDRGIDQVHRGLGLGLAEVTISGRHRAGPEALRAMLDLQLGDPILRLDLDDLRQQIEQNGWVRHASISRHLPGRLHIAINEREPFARWQLNGKTALIDSEGETILRNVGSRYQHLPRLVGPQANLRAGELFDLLERSPRLAAQVRTASLIRERRWDIGMENGVTIRLPETEAGDAWAQFNEVDRRDGLLAKRLKLIDLRVPGRVIVRLKPQPAAPVNSERET
ncbi:cell division protein FtsQ/DivIB [Minwuia sp.]|uniref:cell division protein FtsQ/DivIB n=1 Tax=Minwuia sp. TaxID=2493630 RepID=UPI003A959072